MKDIWNFKVIAEELIVTPKMEQAIEFANDRARDLAHRLNDAEEILIIQSCEDKTLRKLKSLCEDELARRNPNQTRGE